MNSDEEMPDYEACMSRGRSLMGRSRYADAAEWFTQAIRIVPSEDTTYALLAICQINTEGQEAKAVETAARAVSLSPEDSFNRSIYSLALGASAKEGQDAPFRQALLEATEAIRLDPESGLAHTALARAQVRLKKWAAAETSARKALEFDPDDTVAAELLSAALLQQGKHEDHDHLVRYQLENHAEDDSAHSSAGWNALRKGDTAKANQHFREALRLNPNHEGARLGLVESYRARSWIYRSLLQFDAFINKLTGGRQTAFWIGGYLVYRWTSNLLKETAPWAASLLVGAWLLLVFWSSLARGLSSLFMLADRYARLSLKTREKWEGIVVGGMALLSVIALGISFFSSEPLFKITALCLLVGSLPAASAFTNDHYIGKWVYWAVAVFCIGCAFYPILGLLLVYTTGIKLPLILFVMNWGIITAVGFSLVRAFGIGYR